MPQQCSFQPVGAIPVCRKPSKYSTRSSGRLFPVYLEDRHSKVHGKVRSKQIRRATDPSFTSIIDNEDTIPYYSGLLAAETDGSTERADHAVCAALRNFEELGGQYNVGKLIYVLLILLVHVDKVPWRFLWRILILLVHEKSLCETIEYSFKCDSPF
jgi:hypothetical protein